MLRDMQDKNIYAIGNSASILLATCSLMNFTSVVKIRGTRVSNHSLNGFDNISKIRNSMA